MPCPRIPAGEGTQGLCTGQWLVGLTVGSWRRSRRNCTGKPRLLCCSLTLHAARASGREARPCWVVVRGPRRSGSVPLGSLGDMLAAGRDSLHSGGRRGANERPAAEAPRPAASLRVFPTRRCRVSSCSQPPFLLAILLNVRVTTFAVYGPPETELNVLALSPNK